MTPILYENESPCIDRHQHSEAVAHRVGVDLHSGYSFLLFLMSINKCLCKLGLFEEMLACSDVSEIIPFPPRGCMFQILTTCLQCSEKALSLASYSVF